MGTLRSVQFGIFLICIGIFLPEITAQLGCQQISVVSTTFYTTAVRLEWSTNICALSYIVHQFVNGDLFAQFTVTNPVTFILLPKLNCSYNDIIIQTIAIPAAGLFPDISTNFTIPYNGDTEVLHLEFNEHLSRFEWFPPIVPERCANKIQYQVEFENENVQESVITTDTNFPIPNYPCSTNRIAVTTFIAFDISQSEPVTATVIRPISRQPPQHISTELDITSVNVTWRIPSEPNNLCEIVAMLFDIIASETGDRLVVSANVYPDTKIINQVLAPLEPNTNYEYTACYIIDLSDIRICSEPIIFKTPGGPSGLWIDQSNDEFIVRWNQTSGRVLGYTVRIQPIGPLHFVPANCDFDLSSIEIELTGSDITSYNFTGAEASFSYTVELLTHYLGSTFTENKTVITGERTPGDLVIRTSYQGTPSSPYDVMLRASWDIPCNVNGRVQRFDYTLTGTLNSRSVASCRDIELSSGSIDAVEGQVTFKTFIPDIIPSFNHTLRVTTVLAKHESTTVVDLGPAPTAYTSPDWKCTSWIY